MLVTWLATLVAGHQVVHILGPVGEIKQKLCLMSKVLSGRLLGGSNSNIADKTRMQLRTTCVELVDNWIFMYSWLAVIVTILQTLAFLEHGDLKMGWWSDDVNSQMVLLSRSFSKLMKNWRVKVPNSHRRKLHSWIIYKCLVINHSALWWGCWQNIYQCSWSEHSWEFS